MHIWRSPKEQTDNYDEEKSPCILQALWKSVCSVSFKHLTAFWKLSLNTRLSIRSPYCISSSMQAQSLMAKLKVRYKKQFH